ncbi:M15 family metallopeptidase [Bacillus benzoevorans]|nr:M15 family metallopeptidase [Bacillus benzoevorans]
MFTIVIIAFVIYDHYKIKPEVTVPNTAMPDGLHPVVAERMNQLVKRAADIGIVVVITDDFRSAEEQNRLYEKGRTAGGNIVTYAKGGESFHNFGLAVDFALKTSTGDVIWDRNFDGNGNARADWSEVVTMAKELGFEWGGDWPQFKDYPHLQMDFGLSIADLQNGERPPGQPYMADTGL